MQKFRYLIFLLLSLVTVGIATAGAQDQFVESVPPKKLAFVVGNSTYRLAAPLPGAARDAQEIANLLRTLGFAVTYLENVLTTDEFYRRHFKKFLEEIDEGSIVVFFFSGHGFSFEGEGYLLPIDHPARIAHRNDLIVEFISESAIREHVLDRKPGFLLQILDACRENRNFIENQSPDFAPRITKGLPIRRFGESAVISYAAAPGEVAWGSANLDLSDFTSAFLTEAVSDSELTHALKRVRQRVLATTQGRQAPWYSDGSSALIYLKPSSRVEQQLRDAWLSALSSGDKGQVKNYLDTYPASNFAAAARRWLKEAPKPATKQFTQVPTAGAHVAWAQHPNANVSMYGVSGPLALPRIGAESRIAGRPTPNDVFQATSAIGKQHLPADQVMGISLAGEGEAIAMESVPIRSQASTNAFTVETVKAGDRLTIAGVKSFDNGDVWLEVSASGARYKGFVQLPRPQNLPVFQLGFPAKEVRLKPRADQIAALVDERELVAAKQTITERGRRVSWISIGVPEASEDANDKVLSLRAAYIKKRLIDEGMPFQIIAISKTGATNTDAIEVRFFSDSPLPKGGLQ